MSHNRSILALAVAAVCLTMPWFVAANDVPNNMFCAADFNPVPCPPQNSCPNASGFYCGTPAQAQNCFDLDECNCVLNPFGQTSCGLQYACATQMLNGNICKSINNCTDHCPGD